VSDDQEIIFLALKLQNYRLETDGKVMVRLQNVSLVCSQGVSLADIPQLLDICDGKDQVHVSPPHLDMSLEYVSRTFSHTRRD
jgi:hypothetical protein